MSKFHDHEMQLSSYIIHNIKYMKTLNKVYKNVKKVVKNIHEINK